MSGKGTKGSKDNCRERVEGRGDGGGQDKGTERRKKVI
jgi:hypothetical protein